MGIEVLPATGRWDDFATFMVPRKPGGGGCVCMSYRDARLGMPERIAYMHDECERDLWCTGDTDVLGEGVGTCEPDLGYGDACLDGDQCSGDCSDEGFCETSVACSA